MAASHTVPRPPAVQQISNARHVLTLSGFGVRVRMQSEHLEMEDGVGLDRRRFRLPRVGHGLKRLVCLSADGFITLDALNFLSGIGASLVFLDTRGHVRFVTSPTAPSNSRLHRAQAIAINNGVGLKICRALIDAKLKGQEQVVREQIKDSTTADGIARFRSRDLPLAETFERIRTIEAHAALSFFGALRDITVMWPKADLKRIPERYRTIGARRSVLSGGPRLAVTPFHAMENYCTALLESESRIAVSALGLLPDLGLGLHTDRPNRDSLVFDICEPVRPQLESWLIRWVTTESLHRKDFFETATGNVRLTSAFAAKLSETAPTWGKLLAPWAEFVANELWLKSSSRGERMRIASRLTQRHRRAAHGNNLPTVNPPRPEHVCTGCGTKIPVDKKICLKCWKKATPQNLAAGRRLAHTPESRARRAATQRQQRALNRAFDPTSLPAWLTRKCYIERMVPILARVSRADIRKTLGVSEPHAARIAKGIVPHPRHWQALGDLVGVSRDSPRESN